MRALLSSVRPCTERGRWIRCRMEAVRTESTGNEGLAPVESPTNRIGSAVQTTTRADGG